MNLLIKVGSITNAQRSVRLLNAKGYKAGMKKIPPSGSDKSCGWAVTVKSDDNKPIEIIESSGISVRGAEKL